MTTEQTIKRLVEMYGVDGVVGLLAGYCDDLAEDVVEGQVNDAVAAKHWVASKTLRQTATRIKECLR